MRAMAANSHRTPVGKCFIVGSVVEVEAIRVPGLPETVGIPEIQAKEQQPV
jgi:hypothetical protein